VAFVFLKILEYLGEGVYLQIQVWNITRHVLLAENIEIADSFWGRLKGLLDKSSFLAGTGLLIKPCNSIHSLFMRFIFDAVFLDGNFKVVYQMAEIHPFRISPIVHDAQMVLELPAGTISKTGTKIGDQLFLGKRRWC
jgi:uncharacterized membrane protein (UPF0127 family)